MAIDPASAQGRRRQPWLLGSPTRRLRLASGLVLFAYVLSHLLNHALLNVSLSVAGDVLLAQKFIWRSLPGTLAFYGALSVHAALGVRAFYERRHFTWRAAETAQLLLGLAIPAMLANHAMVTRGAWSLYALDKAYVAELDALWVNGLGAPLQQGWGWLQMALLLAAWIHGCIGLCFLLRLRAWWPNWRGRLLTLAVLIPVLALLGFAAGGRYVAALLAQPGMRLVQLPQAVAGSAAQKVLLAGLRNDFLAGYVMLLGAVLLARGLRAWREARQALITITYPGGKAVALAPGGTVLDASRNAGIAHAAVCGGRGRCSTCRVKLLWSDGPLPAPAPHEAAVLARIGADPDRVRLACQLRPARDVTVAPLIPVDVAGKFIVGQAVRIPGEERFVAALFIDLRGSTALAARHLAFDSVFLLGRFISTAAQVVSAHGGRPVQFLGDGLLALFGLESDAQTACRDALAAARAMAPALARLAPLFGQETGLELRYGIGLHCGYAIVGEIGFERHLAFTALGETINLAYRLQELARDLDTIAVISDAVFSVAGESPLGLAPVSARLRGRHDPLPAHSLERAPLPA